MQLSLLAAYRVGALTGAFCWTSSSDSDEVLSSDVSPVAKKRDMAMDSKHVGMVGGAPDNQLTRSGSDLIKVAVLS